MTEIDTINYGEKCTDAMISVCRTVRLSFKSMFQAEAICSAWIHIFTLELNCSEAFCNFECAYLSQASIPECRCSL